MLECVGTKPLLIQGAEWADGVTSYGTSAPAGPVYGTSVRDYSAPAGPVYVVKCIISLKIKYKTVSFNKSESLPVEYPHVHFQ